MEKNFGERALCSNEHDIYSYASILRDIKEDEKVFIFSFKDMIDPYQENIDEEMKKVAEVIDEDVENICVVITGLSEDILREASYYYNYVIINAPEQTVFLPSSATEEEIKAKINKTRKTIINRHCVNFDDNSDVH